MKIISKNNSIKLCKMAGFLESGVIIKKKYIRNIILGKININNSYIQILHNNMVTIRSIIIDNQKKMINIKLVIRKQEIKKIILAYKKGYCIHVNALYLNSYNLIKALISFCKIKRF